MTASRIACVAVLCVLAVALLGEAEASNRLHKRRAKGAPAALNIAHHPANRPKTMAGKICDEQVTNEAFETALTAAYAKLLENTKDLAKDFATGGKCGDALATKWFGPTKHHEEVVKALKKISNRLHGSPAQRPQANVVLKPVTVHRWEKTSLGVCKEDSIYMFTTPTPAPADPIDIQVCTFAYDVPPQLTIRADTDKRPIDGAICKLRDVNVLACNLFHEVSHAVAGTQDGSTAAYAEAMALEIAKREQCSPMTVFRTKEFAADRTKRDPMICGWQHAANYGFWFRDCYFEQPAQAAPAQADAPNPGAGQIIEQRVQNPAQTPVVGGQ